MLLWERGWGEGGSWFVGKWRGGPSPCWGGSCGAAPPGIAAEARAAVQLPPQHASGTSATPTTERIGGNGNCPNPGVSAANSSVLGVDQQTRRFPISRDRSASPRKNRRADGGRKPRFLSPLPPATAILRQRVFKERSAHTEPHGGADAFPVLPPSVVRRYLIAFLLPCAGQDSSPRFDPPVPPRQRGGRRAKGPRRFLGRASSWAPGGGQERVANEGAKGAQQVLGTISKRNQPVKLRCWTNVSYIANIGPVPFLAPLKPCRVHLASSGGVGRMAF